MDLVRKAAIALRLIRSSTLPKRHSRWASVIATLSFLLAGTVSVAFVLPGCSPRVRQSHRSGLASSWPMYACNPQNTRCSTQVGPERPRLQRPSPLRLNIPEVLVMPNGAVCGNSATSVLTVLGPNGKTRWTFRDASKAPTAVGLGVDGTVYAIGGRSLYALSPTGTRKWAFDSGLPTRLSMDRNGRWGRWIQSAPIVGPDGTVYFGGGQNRFYAVDSAGRQIWAFQADAPVTGLAALARDGTVYFTGRGGLLFALNSNGTEKWHRRVTAKRRDRGSYPVVARDGTIYVSDWNSATLLAIRPNGTLAWRHRFPMTHTSGAVASRSDPTKTRPVRVSGGGGPPAVSTDGTLYVRDPSGLHALRPDGREKWKYVYPRAKLVGDLAVDAKGTIYVASQAYELLAIRPDGKLKWRQPLHDAGPALDIVTIPSPTIGKDRTIYFGAIVVGERK